MASRPESAKQAEHLLRAAIGRIIDDWHGQRHGSVAQLARTMNVHESPQRHRLYNLQTPGRPLDWDMVVDVVDICLPDEQRARCVEELAGLWAAAFEGRPRGYINRMIRPDGTVQPALTEVAQADRDDLRVPLLRLRIDELAGQLHEQQVDGERAEQVNQSRDDELRRELMRLQALVKDRDAQLKKAGQAERGLLAERRLTAVAGHTDWSGPPSAEDSGRVASWRTTLSRWWPTTGLSLAGHTAGITAIAIAATPDRYLIASASMDGTVRLWEPELRRSAVRVLHHDRPVVALALNSNAKLLATACSDGTLRLWNPETGHPVETQNPFSHNGRCLAFTPFGTDLLAAAHAEDVKVLNPQTGNKIQYVQDDRGRPPPPGTRVGRFSGYMPYSPFRNSAVVNALAFSPGRDILAAACADAAVRLWNLSDGRAVAGPLTGHRGAVRTITFAPDGSRRLATGGADGTVRLWDSKTAAAVGDPSESHTGAVTGVAFTADGHLLASVAEDATVRLWSPTTGKPVADPQTGHTGPLTCAAFSSDGEMLITGGADGTVRLWLTSHWPSVGQQHLAV